MPRAPFDFHAPTLISPCRAECMNVACRDKNQQSSQHIFSFSWPITQSPMRSGASARHPATHLPLYRVASDTSCRDCMLWSCALTRPTIASNLSARRLHTLRPNKLVSHWQDCALTCRTLTCSTCSRKDNTFHFIQFILHLRHQLYDKGIVIIKPKLNDV